MYKHLFYQSLRFFIVIAVVAGSYFLLKHTWYFFFPIGLAIIFSMFLHPYVTFMENRLRFPRLLATLTVSGFVFILFIGILILMVTEIIQGTIFLADHLPDHFHQFIDIVEEVIRTRIIPLYETILSFLHTLDAPQQEAINDSIQYILSQVAGLGSQFLQSLFLMIPELLTWVPGSATVVVFIVIATILITNDWYKLKAGADKMISPSIQSSVMDLIHHLKKALSGFMRAQFIMIFITMVIIFAGLSILKVEHALTIALLAALIDLLPYIGTGIIFIPWSLYLFITGNYSLTISLTLLYMFIVILRQFLEPKILSSSIGLNPLAVVIALYISIQLWGVAGVIIAPILVVTGNALYQTGIFNKVWGFIKG
ncbi:sporulation integral membrane protein YtvI [Virgibacillus kimchii]